jgi:hypothetical protein
MEASFVTIAEQKWREMRHYRIKTSQKSRKTGRWVRSEGPVRLNLQQAFQDGVEWLRRWSKNAEEGEAKPTVWICQSGVTDGKLYWGRVIFLRNKEIIEALERGEDVQPGLPPIAEPEEKRQRHPCDYCAGLGIIQTDSYREDRCPYCSGDGSVLR